ncbi:MAG: LysE family translocator [Rhodospirillales bacterium]
MLILRAALGAGRRAGFAAVAGVQIGLAVHTALAAAGVSVVIASSPLLFGFWRSPGAPISLARLPGLSRRRAAHPRQRRAGGAGRACRDALLCNLLNPKVVVLFLALYPNFLDVARGGLAAQVAMLSAVLLLINVGWQSLLVIGADCARNSLTRPEVQRTIGRLTGAILLLFAAAMLWEHAA